MKNEFLLDNSTISSSDLNHPIFYAYSETFTIYVFTNVGGRLDKIFEILEPINESSIVVLNGNFLEGGFIPAINKHTHFISSPKDKIK